MRRMSGSWLGEVLGRPEVECSWRGNSVCRTEMHLSRLQEGMMGPDKASGHDPEGKGLRREHVMAFVSQRGQVDVGTRQEARWPIKRLFPF